MAGAALLSLQCKRVSADTFRGLAAVWRRVDCHFTQFTRIVFTGRTQAAFLVKRGVGDNISPSFQENRSRGCLRAQLLFSVFVCWPLWLLVQRKKSLSLSWMSLFRQSPPSRVSTNKTIRRAGRGNPVWHALGAALLFKQGANFGVAGLSALYDPVICAAKTAKLQDRTPC